jgi:hypothetical protein
MEIFDSEMARDLGPKVAEMDLTENSGLFYH